MSPARLGSIRHTGRRAVIAMRRWTVLGSVTWLLVVPTITDAREPVRSLLEIRQAHVIVQDYDLSCGAAALATLLQHQHGLEVTERTLAENMLERAEYRDDPDRVRRQAGFSLLDLQRATERHGMLGEGYGQLDLDDLVTLAPIIVPVNIDGYDHFVVFRGMTRDRVLLADPAWGNRVIPRDTFETAWNTFGDIGHVGFVVRRPVDSSAATATVERHALTARADDFVMLR